MTANVEILDDPSPLKNKVSYGNGGIDADAIARAEQVVAAMQGDYLNWVIDDLDKLTQYYSQAAQLPAADRLAVMRELFGVAHDIKGQGGSFGYDLMTVIASQLCRFIEGCTDFNDLAMDVVAVHVEALRLVIADRLEGEGGLQGKKLLVGLESVLKKAGLPGDE